MSHALPTSSPAPSMHLSVMSKGRVMWEGAETQQSAFNIERGVIVKLGTVHSSCDKTRMRNAFYWQRSQVRGAIFSPQV